MNHIETNDWEYFLNEASKEPCAYCHHCAKGLWIEDSPWRDEDGYVYCSRACYDNELDLQCSEEDEYDDLTQVDMYQIVYENYQALRG